MREHRIRVNQYRRSAAIAIAILLIFLMCMCSTVSAFGGDKSVAEPSLTAKGAVLYCANTNKILYAKNEDTRMSPYSITKLMTALLVTENMSFDKKIVVSEKTASQEGSSMGLEAGEAVTVGQLMHGLLILSGNDAAWALAEAYPGGETAFVAAMNARAKKLGCTNTHFANPNGLDDYDHYTTASDFLLITRAALANKTVKKIASTKRYSMPATNKNDAWIFKTHLDLLTTKGSGVVAGKTGYSEEDDCSIAVEYYKNDLNLYVILIGDSTKQRPKDMVKLFDYANEVLNRTTVASSGKSVKDVFVRHGARTVVKAYTSRKVYAYYASGKTPRVTSKVVAKDGIKAPLKKGDRVGTYKVYVDGKQTASAPIVVKENVKTGWFPSYLYISNRAAAVMLLVIIALYVWLLLTRSRHRRYKSGETARRRPHRGQ